MTNNPKPYSAYKNSGVEWLGDVPAHWEVRRVKSLSLVRRGASPRPIADPRYFDDAGEYAWVRIADVTASNHYLARTAQRLSRLGQSLSVKLEPGALFLSIAGSVGKPIITEIQCCIHDGFVYFPQFGDNVEFLYHVFSCGAPFAKLGKLGTQLNLNTDTVGSIYLGWPPEPEQDAIVRFLDHADRRIQRYIRARQKLIALLEEQKQAIIHQAVTGQIDVRTGQPYPAYKPSGIEWLGDVPAHWEVRRVKSLSLVKRGASPRPIADSRYFDDAGDYAWVRIADVTASNHYLEETTQRLSRLGQSLSVQLQPGALFLSIAGSVGKPIITRIQCCIHDGFVYFPQFRGNVEFLYRVFSCGAPFKRLGKFGTQLNLNTDTVGGIHLGWPPESEQRGIVDFLADGTESVDSAMASNRGQIEMLNEYRTRLIADVVTGKLDVRETAATLPEVDPMAAEDNLDDTFDTDAGSALDEFDADLEEAEA